MKVLFLFGILFGSFSMINAACPESTSIEIELQYVIIQPANLVEAILTAPNLRTPAQNTLIDNEIEAIRKLIESLIPGIVIRTIILKPFSGETKRQAFDDTSAKLIHMSASAKLTEMLTCNQLKNEIASWSNIHGSGIDLIVPYTKKIFINGENCFPLAF